MGGVVGIALDKGGGRASGRPQCHPRLRVFRGQHLHCRRGSRGRGRSKCRQAQSKSCVSPSQTLMVAYVHDAMARVVSVEIAFRGGQSVRAVLGGR